MRVIVQVTIVFVLVLGTASGCFIRNCPPGGKRSIDLMTRGTLPCLSCGPQNSGQCIGPSICCGSFGCYFGTEETQICLTENDRSTPCQINGEPCGARGQGYCVSDGICCDSSACSFNDKCVRETRNSIQLISLLNKILQNGEYE